MSEQASEVKAWWMSARRSQRMVRRRRRASQASVRSSTQRCRPRRSERSTPRRAMRGVMGRSRHSARHRRWSQALSAWSLRGPASRPPATAAHAGHDVQDCRQHRARRGGWPPLEPQSRAACPGRRRRGGACVARPTPVRWVRPDPRVRRRAPPFAALDAARRSRPGSSRARPPRPAAPESTLDPALFRWMRSGRHALHRGR